MYDDDKKMKGKVKAMTGYGWARTAGMHAGWRSPVGQNDGWRRGFTVSYNSSRIVWVSTLRCGGWAEWKKYPKVFS